MSILRVVSYKKIILIDIIFVLFIYLVPTISHLTAYPLYLADPMRLSVLGSYLLLRNRNNSLILAMTLPLVSYLISGHPIAIKNLIIAIELFVNVMIVDMFINIKLHTFWAVLLSIFISKILYYLLKAGAIYWGLLHTSLVDTDITIQLVVAIIVAYLFNYLFRKNNEIIR